MKKILSILLVLVLVLSFAACGNSKVDKEEQENEKYDIELMDMVETKAMNLWIKEKAEKAELCEKLASDGVYYDAESHGFVVERPAKGYGKGTTKDGGESWGYYAAVTNGKGVTKQYDSTKDYTNSVLKVFYDQGADIYYYDWEEVK